MIGRFTNPDGTNYVEPGLMEMLERFRTGRLQVFSNLAPWFEEFRRYHRKKERYIKSMTTLWTPHVMHQFQLHGLGRTGQSVNK